jgi:hypothetical protein
MTLNRRFHFWIQKADGSWTLDRRRAFKCRAYFALSIFFLVWSAATVIASQPIDKSNLDTEHIQSELNRQGRVNLYLIGVVASLAGFIYISGITSVKNSVRSIHQKLDSKMDIIDHDRFCQMQQELTELKRLKRELDEREHR